MSRVLLVDEPSFLTGGLGAIVLSQRELLVYRHTRFAPRPRGGGPGHGCRVDRLRSDLGDYEAVDTVQPGSVGPSRAQLPCLVVADVLDQSDAGVAQKGLDLGRRVSPTGRRPACSRHPPPDTPRSCGRGRPCLRPRSPWLVHSSTTVNGVAELWTLVT